MSLVVDVMGGGVAGGTSIMFAALGETVGERSGVINLGTEGSMLVGALTAYAVAVESGSPWMGALGGAVAGGTLAALHAYLVVFRGASQFAVGLSLLFLALGLTSLFGAAYVGRPVAGFSEWDIPLLSHLPALGPIFFQHDPLLYLSYLLVPTVWFVLFRTRVGLLVRTAGERADSLTVHGYSVNRTRFGAVTVGGMLAGLGGAHLSIAYANAWFENMVSGRGFIAVALVIFAVWSPWRVMGGAYLFGMAIALGPALQARGYEWNQFALDAIPFVMTLAVLAVLGRRTLSSSPAELKRVFENAPT
jgi:general nucleoside transport system permease protein